MNIGNQLYSSLSRLARKSHLMLTELPTMLNVFDATYEFTYSESYSGTVHQETLIEGFEYCASLQRAFESLMSENYTNFVLTVGCITVSIYCIDDLTFKVFDSHARDLHGNSYHQGTCVLLEVSSINGLVHYFQSIHSNDDVFELKGIRVEEVQGCTFHQNNASEISKFNLSCAVAIYSLCYSIMKPCSYWDSITLANIVDNGKTLYNLPTDRYLTLSNLPEIVNICETEVSVYYLNSKTEGTLLSSSVQSKSSLENLIIDNSDCTGFLMWFASYFTSCIYKPTSKSKYVYSLLTYDESQVPPMQYIKSIKGTDSLVRSISNIQRKYQSTEHYEIQFVSCLCKNIDRHERKKIMSSQRKEGKLQCNGTHQKEKIIREIQNNEYCKET